MTGSRWSPEVPESAGSRHEGDRRRAATRRLLLLAVVLLGEILGLGTLMAYNYYSYRTLWGNLDAYPSYVKSFGTLATRTFHSRAL